MSLHNLMANKIDIERDVFDRILNLKVFLLRPIKYIYISSHKQYKI